MKNLFLDIFRVYRKAPLKITFIWLLDILESIIIISNPYIIGNCIDGLLKKDYFWLIILIITETTFWISRTVNKFLDTRIYSNIIKEESYNYYSKMIKTDADCSLIDGRLDLIDDIPNFLEIDFFEILNIIGGIIVSLVFLYFTSTLLVFYFAITSVILIPSATYQFQKNIVNNNKLYKDLNEKRMRKIASRDKLIYRRYLQNILDINISNSDLDTKIFFVSNFLQMMLLFFSILSITYISNFTGGLLFSTVTYVNMLNGYVSDINDNLILLQNLKESTYRLKEENYNEL